MYVCMYVKSEPKDVILNIDTEPNVSTLGVEEQTISAMTVLFYHTSRVCHALN